WTINNNNNNNDNNNNNNNDNNNNNNNDNNNNNNNDNNNNNNNDNNNNNNNDNNNDGTYSSGNSPSSGGGKVVNEADPSQQGDESGSNENSPGSVDDSPSSVGSTPADGMQIQPSVTLSGLSGISMGQISQNLDLNVVNPNKISDDCRKKYGTALPSQFIFTINQTATTNANPINISKYYEEMGGKIMDVYNMTYFKGFSIIINDNTLLEKLKNDPRLDLFDQNIYGISLQNNNNNSDKNNFNSDNSGNNTSFQKSTNGCELDYNKLTKLSKNLSTVQNNYTSKLSTISNNTITSPKIPEIDIAVIDTGISYDHPDLNIYKAVSFVNGSTSANDDLGHGTHVAGVIGARDDGVGISGIIPNAKLWALKVCDYRGLCKISDQIKAIEYVTKNADQIDIVNISIENTNSELLNKAINASIKEGVVYVVAAGNQRINSDQTTPANNPNVITVSAIGDSDGKCGGKGLVLDEGRIADDSFANFSNFGNSITIAAPGVDIFSTYNGTGYAIESGTSMAAPHVTGLAGLIKMKNQNATIEEIKDMILTSSIQPGTLCSSDGDKGYFSGDMDQNSEPLIYLGYNKPVIELPNGFNLTNLVEINAIGEINTASNSTNMVPMNMTNLNTDTTRTFINSASNSGQVISTNTNTIQTQSINNSTNLINK
ncbi:MAG: S8 family serine peptidase, partial [Nitrososphaeraceae archaeon]